jgi:hypothetical protein
MAGPEILVTYFGTAVTHPVARDQLTKFVWAALRKNDYAKGSTCEVMVHVGPDGFYEVRARAKEPTTGWLRLVELAMPPGGIPSEAFEQMLEEQGLAAFAEPSDDSVFVGGDPAAPAPDVVMVGKSQQPIAGRNDPCPCGSGKKYKRCCLQ